MKTNEILELDFRKKENKEIIQKVLRKIKPLSKCSGEQIPVEKLEKCLKVLTLKYAIQIQWITITNSKDADEMLFKLSLLDSHNYKWLGNVYGQTFYEVISKTIIKMYSEIKADRILLRSDSEEIKRTGKLKKTEEQDDE